jgi:hypothetical protein
MSRIEIPVALLEFEEGGSTIWIHSPLGATVLRIKISGVITTELCTMNSVSHLDLFVDGDVRICVSDDANKSNSMTASVSQQQWAGAVIENVGAGEADSASVALRTTLEDVPVPRKKSRAKARK